MILKYEKYQYAILIIVLIISIIWLVTITIPYYQLDVESKKAVIEIAKKGE